MSSRPRQVVWKGYLLRTADSEHIEMYLKAMWRILEKGEEIKVVSIAKILDVKQGPSVVQMLHKLNDLKLIKYQVGSNSIKLTSKGERIGQRYDAKYQTFGSFDETLP